MRIGICVSHRDAAKVDPGFDFIEENIQRFLMPLEPEESFANELQAARACRYPVPAANSFYPGAIRTVGRDLDDEKILAYAKTSFSRARQAGIRILVFGSGASRAIAEGGNPADATAQFCSVLEMIAPSAETLGVTIVVEPLNRGECNFINSLDEGAEIVRRVGHPSVALLADLYHMARENDGPDAIRRHADIIRHVHVAERERRTAPGVAGDDFRPYLRALSDGGYTGDISLECSFTDLAAESAVGIHTLREQLAQL